MESIISLLSNIEKEATAILDRANEQKNSLYKKLEADLHKIDNEYEAKAILEINDFKKKCNIELESELIKIREQSNTEIEDLENKFTNNHDKYLDKLTKNIIGE